MTTLETLTHTARNIRDTARREGSVDALSHPDVARGVAELLEQFVNNSLDPVTVPSPRLRDAVDELASELAAHLNSKERKGSNSGNEPDIPERDSAAQRR